VTESRISQLRSEALEMLREGITAQYEADHADDDRPQGRVARRKAGYATAIADASPWQDRIGMQAASA
jgi:RNA polymerase sigma factor for flagellar operon FliA